MTIEKPENLSEMSGQEAWDSYYKEKLCTGVPVAPELMEQFFLIGIDHAIAYIRHIQDV